MKYVFLSRYWIDVPPTWFPPWVLLSVRHKKKISFFAPLLNVPPRAFLPLKYSQAQLSRGRGDGPFLRRQLASFFAVLFV